MVLVAMATAMTLVLGWLAAQDNSTLVASNASRASAARAAAQSGLEMTVAILESEAPWRSVHDDGWIVRGHVMDNGTVDVRVLDEVTGEPPTLATNLVRLEATSTVGGMTQTAGGLATVHPFDEDTASDLSGYAMYATEDLQIGAQARVQSWNGSGRGARVLASLGDVSLSGRTQRDVRNGELRMHVDHHSGWASGGDASPTALPTILGPIGLAQRVLPPAMENDTDPTDVHVDDHATVVVRGDRAVTGDLTIDRHATVTIEQDCTVRVAGDFEMHPHSAIEVAEGVTLRLIVAGDLRVRDAVIGTRQNDGPHWGTWRQNQVTWVNPDNILITAPIDADDQEWEIERCSLVQGVIEAPAAEIDINRSTLLGRVAGRSLRLRRGARLFFDHRTESGRGLEPLAELVDRLDLMDLHDDGLDTAGRADMIQRLSDLLSRPRDTAITSPVDGWWVHRPVPVELAMTRCGGDTGAWEAAALAAADGQEQP
jgi:hypothetical protein